VQQARTDEAVLSLAVVPYLDQSVVYLWA